MLCPSCEFDNPEGMNFCGKCAHPLILRCPQCEFENPPEFHFCGKCATALTLQAASSPPDPFMQQTTLVEVPSTQVETPPSIEPHTPEAERRQLTVMFTDLVESTALSGQMDAEDYRELVRAYQAACAEVIERFECHLAQTLGDGLLIYSGYPVAHENDAERAIRVGLGIFRAMQTLNERLEQNNGVRLAVRIGIHSGQVVIGEVGAGSRPEQLALGEVPNVAARIQGLAEPDSIVISDGTYRLVEGYFDCETIGGRELRGVAEPIVVHRVLQESGAHNRIDIVSPRGLTPLIGRESESTLLFERWAQVKDGNGQIVLLSGEAGIGKSRLVQVLKDHVVDESHIRWECRSSPYFTNSALYPVIDLIQGTLGWQQDDAPEQRLEKLEQNLSQYQLPLEETVPLFATLLSLPVPEDRYPPLNFTPQRQRQKTLESIVSIILELAEQQPVFFILEDTHWLDASTNELLDLLIDQTPTASLLILLTYRPEFQPSWGNRSYLTQITLNRLSREGIEQMATKVAAETTLPDEILQQLVDKTDGVPLYVEEMTKAVLESGLFKEVDGQYELSSSVSSLSIPATLQDSLMARLDRLVTAKGVAQQAAVIGRQFTYELLQAVSQLDEITLQRELGRLVEAELLYQRGLPPQSTYVFKHALVVTTAYESLLKSTRQQYHQQIAQVLERQFPETAETQPELLAYHCNEANLSEQAILYWQQAGKHASLSSAHAEASHHLTQALELLATFPETPERRQRELELQTTLGPALMVIKGLSSPEVEATYARARALCYELPDTPQLFPVLWGLRQHYTMRGELQTAWELGEQLLRLTEDVQDPVYQCRAHWVVGANAYWFGEFSQAHIHLEQAVTFSHAVQHRSLDFGGDAHGARCLAWLAWVLWQCGYPTQAVNRGDEALHLALEASHPYSATVIRCLLTPFHLLRRDWQTAQEQAETSMTLATEQGFPMWQAWAMNWRGAALAAQGHGAEGIVQMQEGLVALRAVGAAVSITQVLALLAETYHTTGQTKQGLAVLVEALEVMARTGERFYEAELHRLKGQLLLGLSAEQNVEAENCFHQALNVSQSQKAKSWELRAATSLARLWQSQGKRQEAHDLLAPVYEWFTEGLDTADLQDAEKLLAELER